MFVEQVKIAQRLSLNIYIDEEAMTNATPKFREIMGGMRQFFTSPPNPAEAEIIWKSHN